MAAISGTARFLAWRPLPGLILLLASGAAPAVQIDPEPLGIRKMAMVYEHGRGVPQDLRQAYRLYCQSAQLGDAISAYNIGFMYFNGRGLARHHGKAVYWFSKAAAAGDGFSKQLLKRFPDIVATADSECADNPEAKTGRPSVSADAANPNRAIVVKWVEEIAPRYAIDPNLVLAVIQTESAYNPGALSPNNAQGLMQLVPTTAQRFGVKDPWNPLENIRGGIAYLSWLLRRFDGKVEWTLAAYNAGEGAVERHQGVPPYQETQAYVKKILAHYPKTTHPVPPQPPEGQSGPG